MDVEEPIQSLLKNTGWSCEELLERLQKYKALQSNTSEKEKPSSSTEANSILNDTGEPVVDSTKEINNTEYIRCDSSENSITLHILHKETDEIIPSNATVSEETTNENSSLNKSTISEESFEANKNNSCIVSDQFNGINKINSTTNNTANEKCSALNDSCVTNSNLINEEFSDTDEEEIEVNVTNSNIISEIIDDISTTENGEEDDKTKYTYQSPFRKDIEVPEVTEVRIIEVNEEDDNSEEDDSLISSSGKNSIKNIEYLETFPRNFIPGDKKNSDRNTDEENSNCSEEKETENDRIIQISDMPEEESSLEDVAQCKEKETDNDERTQHSDMPKEESNVEDVAQCKEKETDNDKRIQLSDIAEEESSVENVTQGKEKEIEITEDLQKPDSEIDSVEKNIEEINRCKGKETEDLQVVEEENTVEKTSQCEEPNQTVFFDKIPAEDPQECVSNEEPVQKISEEITQDKEKETEESNDKTEVIEDRPSVTKEEEKSENLEDIRNSLKLQLNSLRTRKKSHFLQELINKVANSGLQSNKKNEPQERKEIENSGQNETVPQKTSVTNVLEDKAIETDTNEDNDKLYTQTNELGLVILDVQGGIDLDFDKVDGKVTNENTFNESMSNSENILEDTHETDSNNSIQTTTQVDEDEDTSVFNEIRKIIRKQKDSTTVKSNKTAQVVDEPRSNIGNFQFFSSSSVSDREKDLNNPPNETSSTNENSASSFTTDQITDKNSPFVSNTLDEFLTGNSKLNISYNVPKCGAEEGLSDHYHEVNPLVLKKVVHLENGANLPQRPKKIPKIKAKTVAQKRKMLEKQRLKELKESTAKTLTVEKTNSSNLNNEKNGFVLVNDKKIWVKSSRTDCIAKIKLANEVKTFLPKIQRQRKLSLLMDLGRSFTTSLVKYRPGPLCKKPFLLVSGQDEWETATKKLPMISIEVTPKIGEPISRDVLCRLPQSNGELTEERIEFALSVLKTNVAPKTFKFPVAYRNNQENLILRKRKLYVSNINDTKMVDDTSSVEDIVANVIDKLITYVEIKEIAPTLIKTESLQEDDRLDEPVNEIKKMPIISENVSNILRKPQKRRSKIDLELSRLSCKVVNVEVEEKHSEDKCNKPFCRLGCVCNSLKCERLLSYHCQKHECMLDCNCPKEKTIVYDKLMLPPGTDLLSTDTVSRIEDEAKKDLAKVEREFTQTIIQTNDKTIVVGLGGRNKSRRTPRVPRKYSDFVENLENTKEIPKEDISNFSRKCFVALPRLNLTGVVPYCLLHNLYECHCQGNSKLIPNSVTKPAKLIPNSVTKPATATSSQSASTIKPVPVTPPKELIANKIVSAGKFVVKKIHIKNHKKKKPKLKVDNTEKLVKKIALDKTNVSPQKKEKNLEVTPLVNQRPIRIIIKKKFDSDISYSESICLDSPDCARVRGISKYELNNCKERNNVERSNATENDFINMLNEADLAKPDSNSSTDNKQLSEVEILKQHLINEARKKRIDMSFTIENSLYERNKHKRKQVFEIRNEQGTSVKKKKKTEPKPQPRKESSNTIIESVFDGEIIINDNNMELLKKMGPKTVSDGYARLLPWKALVESFKNGTIKIWSMIDQPSRLLINKSDKPPPKNYINIRQTTQASEVILWILRNKLPSSYSEDNVSFILKQTKDNYEICGICTKNLSSNDNNGINRQVEEKLFPFKHKDLNGEPQLLWLKKETFKLQELIEENLAGMGETSISQNKLYMWAALPEIYRVCKWRVIYLNSDFTYLYFTQLKYSIKYTDLLSAGNIAKSENCTVRLRNQEIQEKYDHVFFGIYFEPHYQDRLFIGPYFKQFNGNDIETLRYINKSLVFTESFNKMQGKVDYKCGHWLIERPYGGTKRRMELDQTIDLTNDNDEVIAEINKPDEPQTKMSKCSYDEKEQVIIYNNEQIKVIDGKPRKPEDFNRYIITNIPHFGYLGAHKHEDDTGIDVCWPFENKLLRFPSVTSSIDFLQERFSSLLQPIPETFQINVIVLKNIDLKNSKPIDARILSGHYICGEFGCCNVKSLTKEFCVQYLGLTRESLLKIFAKRAQGFVKQKIEELAALLNIEKSQLSSYNIVKILEMAQNEIKTLKEREQTQIVAKNDLLLKKRELALRVFCTISEMPEKQKNIENLKFRNILSNRSIVSHTDIDEPIEIPDSDDEKQESADSRANKAPINVDKPTTTVGTSEKNSLIPASITSLFPSQRNMKSVLKPISSPPGLNTSALPLAKAPKVSENPNGSTSNGGGTKQITSPQPNYIKGIKIVKTNSGQLMLVSDNNSNLPRKYSSPIVGTKVVIKNNKILSIKALEEENKASESNSSVKSSPKKVNLEVTSSSNDKSCKSTENSSNVSNSNS